jgi:hypothetical protein
VLRTRVRVESRTPSLVDFSHRIGETPPMLSNNACKAIGLLLGALFLVSSCSREPQLAIETSRDPGADFKSYQTFAWKSGQQKFSDKGEERLRSTADQELIAKGYRKAPEKDADLLIKYAGAQERQHIQKPLVTSRGPTMLMPETVDAGALRLQFVDRKNNRVVWQGQATGVIRNPDNVTEIVPAVKRILAKFPKR